VVLNVKRTHTTHFETLHDTAREKACLPAGLRRGGIAIMNLDDALVSKMPVPGGCRIVRFGEDPSADVRACGASAVWPDRLALDITAGGETAHFQTQLVGTHWTTSVLAATAAALACGVTLQQAARVAGKVSPFHGRMQPEALPCGAIVLRDDFNSSIDTFYPALRVLREARAARKILVITTMSDSGESWSQRLLRIGTETMGWVDQLVLVGEEKHVGKTERRMAGIAYPSERLHCLGSQRAAAELLREMLRAGDLVLLRGLSSDHVGRVFHALQGPVNCWAEYCPRMILCEDCPELHGAPPALIRIRSTASGD
jgi:UDP-N-acetylmuramoyl-tripeptide--D-alanyl-D-alanine ligase